MARYKTKKQIGGIGPGEIVVLRKVGDDSFVIRAQDGGAEAEVRLEDAPTSIDELDDEASAVLDETRVREVLRGGGERPEGAKEKLKALKKLKRWVTGPRRRVTSIEQPPRQFMEETEPHQFDEETLKEARASSLEHHNNVGFEIEVGNGWEVHSSETGEVIRGQYVEPVVGGGFVLTSELSGKLEFVTNPPKPGDDAPRTVRDAIANIDSVCQRITRHKKTKKWVDSRPKPERCVHLGRDDIRVIREGYLLKIGEQFRGEFQATIGVPLAAIPKLFDKCALFKAEIGFAKGKARERTNLVLEAVCRKKALGGAYCLSPEMEGVVFLLHYYMALGDAPEGTRRAFPKGLTEIMARTDFFQMFSMAPEASYFLESPEEWVELILDTAAMGHDAPVFSQDFDPRTPDSGVGFEWRKEIGEEQRRIVEEHFPHDIDAIAAQLEGPFWVTWFVDELRCLADRGLPLDYILYHPDRVQKVTLTRGEWIRGLVVDRRDRLSVRGGGPAILKTMGDMDKTDDLGEESDRGAILELRSILEEVRLERWPGLCDEILLRVAQLNRKMVGDDHARAMAQLEDSSRLASTEEGKQGIDFLLRRMPQVRFREQAWGLIRRAKSLAGVEKKDEGKEKEA